MNWRDLPPLPALRAFAAYAETGNLEKAGALLNVTHAAISQQIRKLEEVMDVHLLDRTGRQAQLTPQGQRLAQALLAGFGTMADEVAALTGASEARALTVTTTPSFAANWLVPCLASFRAAHPEIDVVIDANPGLTDMMRSDVDVALRFGKGDWPGLDAQLLLPTRRVAVAAPEFLAKGRPTSPEELNKFPILQEAGTSESSLWLEKHGVTCAGQGGFITLPGNLTLDAARSGQGIVVTAEVWVKADLDAGRLVALFGDEETLGYYIVTRPGVHRKALKSFVRWAGQQAGCDFSGKT